MATTRMTWARYDQPRLLTGNVCAGIGIEIDRRVARLCAEAEGPRSAAAPARHADGIPGRHGLGRRLGLGFAHLLAIRGIQTHRPRHAEPPVR